jgi:hypothetical protein
MNWTRVDIVRFLVLSAQGLAKLYQLNPGGLREPVRAIKAGQIVRLKSQDPNHDDRAEHGQTGNRPAGCVAGVIPLRSIDHLVVPVGHTGLPEFASGR